MPSRRPAALAATLVFAALPLLAASVSAAPGNPRAAEARARHEAVLAYWTPERMRAAVPRDFAFDPARGFQPAAKPPDAGKPGGGGGGGGGGGDGVATTTSGASWPDGRGEIYGASGKVFFSMGGGNWVCSGTVVEEAATDRSIVMTAGHCAYDETVNNSDSGFATNWMFFPKYDADPTLNCATSVLGCWTAEELVVHSGYATAGGFNTAATLHDWAFAVVGQGGRTNQQLDQVVDSFPISAATSYPSNTQTYAFGFPAAGKYRGNDLTYCAGAAGFDPLNGNNTYRLSCKMTGGSSGGGWLVSFQTSGDAGTLSSVNSYGYSGISAMHGPKFNAKTGETWTEAQAVAFDGGRGLIVSGP